MGAVEYKDTNRIFPAGDERFRLPCRTGGLTPLIQFARRPWGLRTIRYSIQDFLPCGHHLGTTLLGGNLGR